MSYTIEEILPEPGDRAVLVGATGSGKTVLERVFIHALAQVQPVIVVDCKGKFYWPDADVIHGKCRVSSAFVIYKPSLRSDVIGDVNWLLEAAFNRGDTTVVFDDAVGMDINGKYPDLLRNVYCMGRERGVTCIACIQRPVSVPRYMITEAERTYLFRLKHPDDRALMAGMVGHKALELPPKYHFWYDDVRGGDSINVPLKVHYEPAGGGK